MVVSGYYIAGSQFGDLSYAMCADVIANHEHTCWIGRREYDIRIRCTMTNDDNKPLLRSDESDDNGGSRIIGPPTTTTKQHYAATSSSKII